ncbi:hypothetical protein QR680_005905 [Steinernema hermaphroditum]|uniref:Uncharacterized protein n=1 Tax=Steinernema hermaphroditum TaxID=289476 RepID=A0AA39HV29_9BILA|nr:hypothetical protein QR680_005905 [Steinernema hermaphroditum]
MGCLRSYVQLSMEEGKGSRYSSSKEIRSVLVRHWKSLDRARLHTFHLWLLIYSLAEIFILQYLCPNSQSIPCLVLSSLFILYLILSFIPIRYGDHNKRFSSVVISLISTVVFPVFLWIIHIPTLTQKGRRSAKSKTGEITHWCRKQEKKEGSEIAKINSEKERSG